jgi:hypothetical protein
MDDEASVDVKKAWLWMPSSRDPVNKVVVRVQATMVPAGRASSSSTTFSSMGAVASSRGRYRPEPPDAGVPSRPNFNNRQPPPEGYPPWGGYMGRR